MKKEDPREELTNKIKTNIWKYYLATSLASFAFFTPIIQLFYLSKELTIFNIAILGVVWSITRLIFEIPSSILADKWGRKKTLVLAFIFAVLQIITLLISFNYSFFILASIFSALSFAFFSGTNVAFFYDTLKVLKREREFEKLWAREQVYQQIPFLISFILSGFLFKLSPLLPFQLSLIFFILSFFITLTLIEPPFHKPIEEKNIFSHFRKSINYVFKDKSLKAMLIFVLLYCLASDFSYGYSQVYLNSLSTPIFIFGLVYALKSIFCMLAANFTPKLKHIFSYSTIFIFEIISFTILFYMLILTNNYIIGAICLVLAALVHGTYEISRSSYIHDKIESHNRATIDSVFSFFVALMFLIIEPLAGYLADIYSIKLPFFIIAIITTIYSFYLLINGRKKF